MKNINDIFSAFNLSNSDVDRLSNEAKTVSISCGKKGVFKDVKQETWDLFFDISEKVWYSDMSNAKKISLGFQLFEIFPNYFHFLVPFYDRISNKEVVDQDEKNIIWKQFMNYLVAEDYY